MLNTKQHFSYLLLKKILLKKSLSHSSLTLEVRKHSILVQKICTYCLIWSFFQLCSLFLKTEWRVGRYTHAMAHTKSQEISDRSQFSPTVCGARCSVWLRTTVPRSQFLSQPEFQAWEQAPLPREPSLTHVRLQFSPSQFQLPFPF